MNENNITRRKFLATTAAGLAAASLARPGFAASSKPIELSFFFRAAWPSSEPYNNWIIEQWNAKNGDRIHVTGSSADGETYKTKQTIELSSTNPPDVFYSWEGGRAGELIDNGFAAELDGYYTKYGWDKRIIPAGQALATYDGKKYFLPTEMCSSVVWYRKDLRAARARHSENMGRVDGKRGQSQSSRTDTVHALQPEKMAFAVHVVGHLCQ
jgi:ABC-type glycerol-3-phosphate transport system substrate-binding protein